MGTTCSGSQLDLLCSPILWLQTKVPGDGQGQGEGYSSAHLQAVLLLRYIHGHGYDDAQEDHEAPEVEEGLLGRGCVLVESREVAVLLLEHPGPEPRGNSEAQ